MRNTFIWIHCPLRLVGSLLFSVFSCLSHIQLEMKINCRSVLWRAGNTFTFSSFPDSFAYILISCVSLPIGNWTVCFLFTLVDVVVTCDLASTFISGVSPEFYGIMLKSKSNGAVSTYLSVLCCNSMRIGIYPFILKWFATLI